MISTPYQLINLGSHHGDLLVFRDLHKQFVLEPTESRIRAAAVTDPFLGAARRAVRPQELTRRQADRRSVAVRTAAALSGYCSFGSIRNSYPFSSLRRQILGLSWDHSSLTRAPPSPFRVPLTLTWTLCPRPLRQLLAVGRIEGRKAGTQSGRPGRSHPPGTWLTAAQRGKVGRPAPEPRRPLAAAAGLGPIAGEGTGVTSEWAGAGQDSPRSQLRRARPAQSTLLGAGAEACAGRERTEGSLRGACIRARGGPESCSP